MENILSKKNNQGLVKITKGQFLKDYTIRQVQRECRNIKTINDALCSNLPTITCIKKYYGEDFIQAYIEGWIVNIREFINVGKKMTDEQTQETAAIIIDEFYNLNLSDINIIFRNAKIGRYGQIYDRLDGQIILSWFESHFNKRCKIAANESILEGDKHKSDRFLRTSTSFKLSDIIDDNFRK